MVTSLRQVLLCLALLTSAAAAHADAGEDDQCRGPSADCVAVGHWNLSIALGAGVRTNPLVDSRSLPLVVIPHVSYYGERFFLDDLDVGFTIADGAHSTLSLIASPGYDRVFFYRSDWQNIFVGGLAGYAAASPATEENVSRSPQVTYLAGPEWTFKYSGISGQLDVLREITGRNHGDEVRAALGIPLVQERGSLSANVGLTWKSAAIVNYYYGAPGIYTGGAALNPFLKLSYSRPLSKKWEFVALAEYERLGAAIAQSPIVAEHYVATVFVGAIHTL
jgi:MipA family protein